MRLVMTTLSLTMLLMTSFIGQSSASSSDLEIADKIKNKLYLHWVNNKDRTRFATVPVNLRERDRKQEHVFQTIKSVKKIRGKRLYVRNYIYSFYKNGTLHLRGPFQPKTYRYKFINDRIIELRQADVIVKKIEMIHLPAFNAVAIAPNRWAFRNLGDKGDGVTIDEIADIKK